MSEFEQGLIITGDCSQDADALTRGLRSVPDGYRSTPIVDMEGLNEMLAKGSKPKFAIVDVSVQDWEKTVQKLRNQHIDVYVYSVLNSRDLVRKAYANGALEYKHTLGEIFDKIAPTTG